MGLHNNKSPEQPPYLESLDELEKVRIARLKGNIDQEMVPIIEQRIEDNRKKEGMIIDKNIIIDYARVDKVDTAAIAFHLVRLKETEAAGKRVGFINVSEQLKAMLDMFKQGATFRIYASEEEAISELNQ